MPDIKMKIFAETERLILRELLPSDDEGMFELDADPDVHIYLGNKPVERIEQSREIIEMVRQQYIDNGIGRWAVVEKNTARFLGWAGLKLMKTPTNGRVNFYDLGYRFIKRYWGRGFATEAAKASVEYGFDRLKLESICATADVNNTASRKVLEKAGLKCINIFIEDGYEMGWYELPASTWLNERSK